MALNYKKLVQLHEAKGGDGVAQLFESKELRPEHIELGALFAECFGWGAFNDCRAGRSMARDVMEAAGAVSTNAFQNISGQLVINAVQEAYEREEFAFTKLIPEVMTNLNGEKIPAISEIGDEALETPEGDPFTLAGVVEDWINTPTTIKRGMIVPVTREAIFFDRTGVLLDRCRDVGYALGVNVEKRAIDAFIDENVTTHRYNWRTLGAIATYNDNTGSHTWDNLSASTTLTDWKSIDTAEQLFNNLLNPITGEPIAITATHLVVTKQNEKVAQRILNATELRDTTAGYATTGSPTQAVWSNPVGGKYQLVSSRLLAARMATDTTWYLANIPRMLKRMVNFPLSVREAPANSHDEFHRDIVQQFRADERSAFVVVEPRAAVKCTV